jgi:hypothetical protein
MISNLRASIDKAQKSILGNKGVTKSLAELKASIINNARIRSFNFRFIPNR